MLLYPIRTKFNNGPSNYQYKLNSNLCSINNMRCSLYELVKSTKKLSNKLLIILVQLEFRLWLAMISKITGLIDKLIQRVDHFDGHDRNYFVN